MTLAPEKLQASREDIDAVSQAVVDYCEGYYRRDPEQTARAYHPEFLKRAFQISEDGASYLITLTDRAMIERAHLDHLRVEDPECKIVIDDISEDIASVRLYSDQYVDYLHVVKARGLWRLLHATWAERESEHEGAPEEDIDGVIGAAMDYVEAWFQGDAERHARAYHAECVKRVFSIDSETGQDAIELVTPQLMVETCATGKTMLEDCEIDVVIDEIYEDVATVRAYSCKYVDYLHVVRARGEWKLLHVTWTRR